MILESEYIFWEYLDEYGIYDEEQMEYVGMRDDAPEEVKRSWEEYQKRVEEWEKQGIK